MYALVPGWQCCGCYVSNPHGNYSLSYQREQYKVALVLDNLGGEVEWRGEWEESKGGVDGRGRREGWGGRGRREGWMEGVDGRGSEGGVGGRGRREGWVGGGRREGWVGGLEQGFGGRGWREGWMEGVGGRGGWEGLNGRGEWVGLGLEQKLFSTLALE